MKKAKRSGAPLDLKKYLKKFDGLEISSEASKMDSKKKAPTILIDKWAPYLFDEGFVGYNGEGPP